MGNFQANLKAFCCRLPDVMGPQFKEEPLAVPFREPSRLEKSTKKVIGASYRCPSFCESHHCPPDDYQLYSEMPPSNTIYATQPGTYVSDLHVTNLFRLEEITRRRENEYQRWKNKPGTHHECKYMTKGCLAICLVNFAVWGCILGL